MAQQNMQIIIDGQWIGGVDSLLYPTDLAPSTYAWAVNLINRGGVVQTRPGKRLIMSFCGHVAQGFHWCRTMDDYNFLLVAIDGYIYVARFPFVTWTQLSGVSFSPTAPRIYFCTGEQAIQYDAANNIELLTNPVNVVCMQDGVSTPCYWIPQSGVSGQITTATDTGTPASPMRIGTAMAWQDNRLWLAVDNLVYASTLLYPQNFQEDTYLAEQTGFRFPRTVINMFAAPVQGLLVMTDSSMHSLMSYIQDRTTWNETQGFQSDVNLEVGLVAPFAFTYLHGMPWFLTARGIISYDRALTQNLTTVLLTADGEMNRSKNLMGPNVTIACAGVWENVLLFGIPCSSPYNRHTWIMDAGIAEKLNNTAGMCWSSIWVGTFPVQFASPIIDGTQHNYELSYCSGFLALQAGDSPSPQPETQYPDQAYIHVWENFMPNLIANVEDPVSCSFETKAYTLATDDYYRFAFAEFMIVQLKGVVPFQCYVCGLAGNYVQLFTTTLRADIGPWGNPSQEAVLYYVNVQGGTTTFENYRKQVRHLRSMDFVVKDDTDDGASAIEILRPAGIDKAFQIMCQWQGKLGIRQLKFFYDRQIQQPYGNVPVDEAITPHITLEATA